MRHRDRPTGLSCSRCGRPACPQCLRPAAVGQHCVDCLNNDGVQRAPAGGSDGITRMVDPKSQTRPTVTYSLIGINVLVFVLCVVEAGSLNLGAALQWGEAPLFEDTVLFPPWVLDGDYWRLLSSGFLHWSITHLALNMISLFILGRSVEAAIGPLRFLGVYLVSLLGGSAAVMQFSPNSATAGASGAVYGLMGAILVIVLRAKVSPTPFLAIIAINLVLSVTIPNISLAGHLGGLLFGALAAAGLIVLPGLFGAGPRTPAARRIGWAALGILVVLAVSLSLGVAVLR